MNRKRFGRVRAMSRYKIRRERISRLMSSCPPINHALNTSGILRTTSRKRRPARHSKSTSPSFRIAMPLCRCGLPKTRQNSSSASKASICSAFGSFSSWPMSSAVSSNDFLKFLEGGMFDGNGVAAQNIFFQFKFRGFPRSVCFLPRNPVFFPKIFVVDRQFIDGGGGPHLNRAQRNNRRPRDNADILATNGGVEPFAQISSGVGNRERMHTNFLASI